MQMRNKYRKLKAVNTDSFVKKNFNNHAVTNDARNGWGTSLAYVSIWADLHTTGGGGGGEDLHHYFLDEYQ